VIAARDIRQLHDADRPLALDAYQQGKQRAIQRNTGFCNGGIVAYEMACQLEGAGISVRRLAMVDAFLCDPTSPPLLRFMRRAARKRLTQLGMLRSAPQAPAGAANWGAWHATLVEAWYAALARYAPRPYAGKIVLLWSDEMAARAEQLTRSWQRVAPQAGVGLGIPGTHLTSLTRHLAETSAILAEAIVRGVPPAP
jgi:thioesterase domain-containing protein